MANRKRKDVFTTGQVATICNVAPRTVSKWFDNGQLRGYRIPGSKDRRIPLNHLVRFMKAHGIPLAGLDVGVIRVLLVDDDAELANLVSKALSADKECEVTVAASAFEAGVLAESFRPYVTVVDVSLSDVVPKRICQALRTHEHLSNIKLIGVSRTLSEGQGQALLQDGFAGYLPKPFDIADLRALIDEVAESNG